MSVYHANRRKKNLQYAYQEKEKLGTCCQIKDEEEKEEQNE